jgi:hypothetical protein
MSMSQRSSNPDAATGRWESAHRPRGPQASSRVRSHPLLGWVLRVLAAVALVVDAVVHFALASTFDPIRATVSQGQLFRVEGAAAALAAVLILVVGNRLTWLFALLVLASGVAAVMFYQLVDPGVLGPLPDMYDPFWSPGKVASLIAEAAGTVIAAAGLAAAVRAQPLRLRGGAGRP